MLKAVILIGGPLKGTRFRPLSFEHPKPLFPVAGIPMVQHLIESCVKVPNLNEIFLIGFYQQDESFSQFLNNMMRDYNVNIRYLQEFTSLGTAGGIYHFRDQIRKPAGAGEPEAFFVLNGDVCGEFPLNEMLAFHRNLPNGKLVTVMGTDATRQQAQNYGCIVENANTHEILHYVEKPSTFVSSTINCGVYLCSLEIFQYIANIFKRKSQELLSGDNQNANLNINGMNGVSLDDDCISLEKDVLMPLASAASAQAFVFHTTQWWSHIKTAGSALFANRHYLELFHKAHPDWLAKNSNSGVTIIGDVFIHPTAKIDPTAVLGPNVSISEGVSIGAGVRIRESIVLKNATIHDHSLVLHAIIGWNCVVGLWSRIEGTPCDPNPNKPFAQLDNKPLFNGEGKLNASITVLGSGVSVPSEVIVLNSIVLPHKELRRSYKNEIIL